MTPAMILKLIDPIKKRIMNFFARGVVQDVDDTKGIQTLKASLFSDEIQDKMERFQNYGFTSNPKKGSEALVVFHSGNRDHGIVIAVDDRRYRLKGLENGEVAMFSDEGDYIHFKRGNKIDISTKELNIVAETKVNITSTEANITSPKVKIEASESVTMTTPLLNVSGLVNCAGIGAGAPAEAGKAKVQGSVEASGAVTSGANVSDSAGSMAQIRTKYNSHKHNPTDPVPNPLM